MGNLKRIMILFVAAACLAGCAQFDQVVNTLSSPQTTQALSNVRTAVNTVTCGLSAAAAAAQGVEAGSYGGAPIVDQRGQRITAVVYAGSSAACALTGGVVVKAAQ